MAESQLWAAELPTTTSVLLTKQLVKNVSVWLPQAMLRGVVGEGQRTAGVIRKEGLARQ